ncbi:MAG: Gfo/Idh/MocA family oxidoreductase [Polyangiaceae bacterium]|nr:Gfo/Idh/MocA family oxidoreductase [Polyangiaceae bacterium]
MSLRVAFIGTGQIAESHLKGLHSLAEHPRAPEFTLSSVVDTLPGRAAEFAKAYVKDQAAPQILSDYRELLKGPERPDIAAILVPHHLHLEVTSAFLEAGIAVQLQKPIGLGIRDGRRIVELAQKTGTPLVISEPAVLGKDRAQIDWLRSGQAIGKPTFMIDQAVLDLKGGFFMTPWRHLKAYAGAGWFIDHGVHRTHWMLDVLGPCKTAFARTRQLEATRANERWGKVAVDTEDLAMATLEFESGALCQFSVASGGRGGWHFQVKLWGERGSWERERFQLTGEEAPSPIPDLPFSQPADPFGHSFLELAQLMQDPKAAVIGSAERALEAEAIIYACLESAHTGEPVAVADILSGKRQSYEATVWALRERLAYDEMNRLT